MEIRVSSISFVNELTRYTASRLATVRIAALTVLVIAMSLVVSPDPSPTDIGTTALLAALLIAQFRLWDDLADVDFDRVHHPHRVLVASRDVRPYFILVIGLTVLNTVVIAALRSPAQLLAYVLLLAGMAMIYRRRTWSGSWRLVRTQLVLIKYPVFLYLCAQGGLHGNFVWGILAIYLLLSFMDLMTDTTLQSIPARRWLLSLELIALVVILVSLTWSMRI